MNSQPMPSTIVPEEIHDYRACYFMDNQFTSFFAMHHHAYYEVLFHRRNGIQFSVGQQIYDMRPFDVYIIPPLLIHGLIGQDSLVGYERFFLHISESMVDALGFGVVDFRSALEQHMQQQHYHLSLTPERFERFRELLVSLSDADAPLSPYDRLNDRLALAAFMKELCQALDQMDQPGVSSTSTSLAHQVFNYVNLHYTEDCSLEKVASLFNTSKYNLSHRFSSEFHMSLYRYVLFCRVSLAQRLIKQNEPLTSIAYRCGFNDYSNFLRAFSSITGTNPSQFRKSENAQKP